jgi:hypothetical protein
MSEYDDALRHAISVCKDVASRLDHTMGQAAARLCAKGIQKTLDLRNGKSCPYCGRTADKDGATYHGPGCAGLEEVTMNRLQYDALLASADTSGVVKP